MFEHVNSTLSQVLLATKASPFDSPLTKENVLKQANTSLQSLQVDFLDTFYLHAPDRKTPLEETLEAVQQLYEGNVKVSLLEWCPQLIESLNVGTSLRCTAEVGLVEI